MVTRSLRVRPPPRPAGSGRSAVRVPPARGPGPAVRRGRRSGRPDPVPIGQASKAGATCEAQQRHAGRRDPTGWSPNGSSRRDRVRTPATVASSPGRSGAATVTVLPSAQQLEPPAASRAPLLGSEGRGRCSREVAGPPGRRRSARPAGRPGRPSTVPRRTDRSPGCRPRSGRPAAPGCPGRRRRRPPAAAVAGSSRSRRVATSGSSRWWRTIVSQGGDIAVGQAEAGGQLPYQRDADVGVIAAAALADVMQEGAEQQQIRAGDRRGSGRRPGRGLHQVPIDGEAVVGVALRLVANRCPLGQVPHPDANLVEGLDGGHGGSAGAEQSEQGVQGLRAARRPAAPRPRPPRRSRVARAMGLSSSARRPPCAGRATCRGRRARRRAGSPPRPAGPGRARGGGPGRPPAGRDRPARIPAGASHRR